MKRSDLPGEAHRHRRPQEHGPAYSIERLEAAGAEVSADGDAEHVRLQIRPRSAYMSAADTRFSCAIPV
jgi:hypothetical protein